MAESRPKPANPDGEDLVHLRSGIHAACQRFAGADFDSVNVVLTLKRTTTEFENFVLSYFKQYDLSPGRFNVLMSLFRAPDHTQSLSDLGDYLLVTRANITGLVDGLVADGLLRRIDHPDDRRVVLAQLTEKAVEFLDWFAPLHLKNLKALMSVFTDDEKRRFVALLDKMRAQMRKLGALKIPDARAVGD